jgi:hypothetical protein
MTTNEKVLRYIAAHSPKTWAKAIRNRFETVLADLEKCKEEVIRMCSVDPDSAIGISYSVDRDYRLGCPHCSDFQCEQPNNKCLYTKAFKLYDMEQEADYPCADAKFGGYCLGEIDSGSVRIVLSAKGIEWYCTIRLYNTLNEVLKDFDRVISFCLGHIEWTKDPTWGTKQ